MNNNNNIKVKKTKDNSKSKKNNKKIVTIENNKTIKKKENNELSCNSVIIYNIFKYLNVDEINLCSLVNKEWNKVSNSNKIWELLFLKNLFKINYFMNEEKEIYSKGCLKKQLSNVSFKFKDLYKLCFPQHFNRFTFTNVLKNFEIIPSKGDQNTNEFLPNIKNFEDKLFKSIISQVGMKSSRDREKEIAEKIKNFINYIYNIKKSYIMENICSYDNAEIFLIDMDNYQLSKNRNSCPLFCNSFQYLICISKNVGDDKKIIKEYSRLIQMELDINVAYNTRIHFPNDGSNYSGELMNNCNYSFRLFDIDNPTFDDNKNLCLIEYNDKELKKNQTISTLDLWYNKHKEFSKDHYFVSSRFIKGLNEFSRNNIDFGNDDFYSDIFSENYFSFEYDNGKHNFTTYEQIDSIKWKLKLYLNFRKKLSFFQEHEKYFILQFIENSTIFNFQKSNTIQFYKQYTNTNFHFEFSLPYENNVLTISIYYQYSLDGDSIDDTVEFSIEFKFKKDNVFKNLYKCYPDLKDKKPKTICDYNKELIENIKVDNLLFQDFISLLFKNKFPLLNFKLSTLLLLLKFDKFISFTGKKGNQIPELSKFGDYY